MHSEPSLDPLEQELAQALRRVEAPAGFAEGLLNGLYAGQAATQNGGETESQVSQASVLPGPRPLPGALRVLRFRHGGRTPLTPAIAGLAAALLLMLVLPLGGSLYQRHREAQAEQAVRQFALAMRLTHAALLDAGQQVHGHARNQ